MNVLYGYIDSKNGYGISAQSLIGMLSKIKGVDIDLLPLTKPNIQNEKKLKDEYDILILHVAPGSVISDIQQNGYIKMVMSRCKKRYQYVLWETDKLPKQFTELFSHPEWIHGLICPSKFLETLCAPFRKLGKEVHYIPITMDNVEYNKDQRINNNGKFTVLTIAQMSVRKAIDISVCAYVTAFNGHKDTEYYIKIGERVDQSDVEGLIRGNVARSMIAQPPPIYLIDEHLPEHEIRKLYLGSDCYLHLSRGEGFGMTPLAAINHGLPVVYTDWSAHAEFLSKDKNSVRVEGRIDLVHSMDPRYGYEPGQHWFETKIASAVDGLNEAYNRWKNKKISYSVPAVVHEYREAAVMPLVAKFLGIEKPEIMTHVIEGVKVEEL